MPRRNKTSHGPKGDTTQTSTSLNREQLWEWRRGKPKRRIRARVGGMLHPAVHAITASTRSSIRRTPAADIGLPPSANIFCRRDARLRRHSRRAAERSPSNRMERPEGEGVTGGSRAAGQLRVTTRDYPCPTMDWAYFTRPASSHEILLFFSILLFGHRRTCARGFSRRNTERKRGRTTDTSGFCAQSHARLRGGTTRSERSSPGRACFFNQGARECPAATDTGASRREPGHERRSAESRPTISR